ncbi:MAG TPA: hypothetical protein VN642_10815 [Dongiaceae bacterium]|nr:hypothetical protein [Dongiaceae bacterium]
MGSFFFCLATVAFLLVSCGPAEEDVTSTTTSSTTSTTTTASDTSTSTTTTTTIHRFTELDIKNIMSPFSKTPSAAVMPLDVTVQVTDISLIESASNAQVAGNTLSFHLEPGTAIGFRMAKSLEATIEKITVTNLLTGESSQTTGASLDRLLLHEDRIHMFASTLYVLWADSFFVDAETLAIEATGALTAPQVVYDRVGGELAIIRSAHPDVSKIVAQPSWVPQNLLVGFDATGAAEVLDGTYTAWNDANARYGVTQVGKNQLTGSGGYALLDFGGRFINIPLLAKEYAKLPHVTSAAPNGIVGDGNDVCLEISGDTHFFIFDAGSGDCPAGCINHVYRGFSVDGSGTIADLGTWQVPSPGVPPPQWFQDLSSCRNWL